MAKHLYCVTSYDTPPQSPPWQGEGKSGSVTGGVYLIPYKDIALVVKESPSIDYKDIPREALVQYLFAHQAVIEEIMKERTAVPIKFGTTAVNDVGAREILEFGYARFKDAVDGMKDKTEIEVIARWNDLDPVLKEIGNKAEIRRFKEGIKTGGQSNFQSLAVELGRMVKTALNEENSRVRDEIRDVLNEHAVEFRLHDPLDDRMIMNAAFLIQKGREGLLEEEVEKLDNEYGNKVDFRVVGPLPPHSFNTLEIKRIKAQEVQDDMKVLELNAGSGKAEIKEAYRRLVQRYHPDKNPDPDAGKQFERIRDAYKNLLNLYIPSHGGDAIMVRVV